MDATRADIEFTAEVCAIAVEEGATVVNIPDTVGYTTPEEYAGYFRRLYELVPGAARGRDCRSTATTTWAWPSPTPTPACWPGARQVECAVNGIGERAGNCSLEEIAMLIKVREDAHGLSTGIEHPRDRPHQPHGLAPDRLRDPAQQGDRRPQRLRPRVRDPPGRRAEGAQHLRDHGRDRSRPGVELDRARQALRPPRPERRPGAAGLQGRGQRPQRRLQGASRRSPTARSR